MTEPRVELRRVLDVEPGSAVPSLVGCTVDGSVVAAEVADVEETVRLGYVDDEAGSLAGHGIRLLHDPAESVWDLDLPAAAERVTLRWPATDADAPPEALACLTAVVGSPLQERAEAVHVRAVRHLLLGDGVEIGHLVVESPGPYEAAGELVPPTCRVEVLAEVAGVRAELERALVGAGLELAPAPDTGAAAAVAGGAAAAGRALRAADPALRLGLVGAAGWHRAAVRDVLAALATRRQVGDLDAAALRSDVDRVDGAVSALDDAEAVAEGLAAAGVESGGHTWLGDRLAGLRQAGADEVRAELESVSYAELLAALEEPPLVSEPSPGVLADLAERAVRRVERRLAELGRAQTDHDLLWVVGGARRAVARARFPGLLGADGRRKRARRIADLLEVTDQSLGRLAVLLRAKGAAVELADVAGAPAGLTAARDRLAADQKALVADLAELRERLRRRRKK